MKFLGTIFAFLIASLFLPWNSNFRATIEWAHAYHPDKPFPTLEEFHRDSFMNSNAIKGEIAYTYDDIDCLKSITHPDEEGTAESTISYSYNYYGKLYL